MFQLNNFHYHYNTNHLMTKNNIYEVNTFDGCLKFIKMSFKKNRCLRIVETWCMKKRNKRSQAKSRLDK